LELGCVCVWSQPKGPNNYHHVRSAVQCCTHSRHVAAAGVLCLGWHGWPETGRLDSQPCRNNSRAAQLRPVCQLVVSYQQCGAVQHLDRQRIVCHLQSPVRPVLQSARQTVNRFSVAIAVPVPVSAQIASVSISQPAIQPASQSISQSASQPVSQSVSKSVILGLHLNGHSGLSHWVLPAMWFT
jgi:hypothetical protein